LFVVKKFSVGPIAGVNSPCYEIIVVKEMFTKTGDLRGWAVMVKTNDDSDSGKGWFWYQVTSVTDPSKIAAIGNGVPGFVGCHTAGNDMALSSFPLK
jgi:hypothetical protein